MLQEFWLHILVPLIQIYSILSTVSKPNACPYFNSISILCWFSDPQFKKKKKKAMSFGMERKLENVKKGFILIKNLYLYQYSLNSLLYGYFTTVWMYPVLPSWKRIFMVFQIYHFALNLIHFWNFHSKDKLNRCIYLVYFHVLGEYYWL